jgi:hypothetical protein
MTKLIKLNAAQHEWNSLLAKLQGEEKATWVKN